MAADRPARTREFGPRLLVILGPTGTGKSELALRVAERLGGEIVGCDSLQIYRGFDVGTAKPGATQLARVPHHLVDELDPGIDGTLAGFVQRAETVIGEIEARGHVPIVVGGTGLYLRGLLRGVVPAPSRDPELRARLYRMIDRFGSERMHRWLSGLDRETADRIRPKDPQRVVRALELALAGDATWSERLRQTGTWKTAEERYPNLKIGVDLPREQLRSLLDARVDHFFADGLIAEVIRLLETVRPDANAFKAIGYREIVACLDEGRDPEEARDRIKANTRRYAKRQRTWFRVERDVHWLDPDESIEARVERVLALWGKPLEPDGTVGGNREG